MISVCWRTIGLEVMLKLFCCVVIMERQYVCNLVNTSSPYLYLPDRLGLSERHICSHLMIWVNMASNREKNLYVWWAVNGEVTGGGGWRQVWRSVRGWGSWRVSSLFSGDINWIYHQSHNGWMAFTATDNKCGDYYIPRAHQG